MDRLGADKKDALRTMELLAEATGVDIRLIAQKSDQKGNVKGYQGLYNKKGNYIEIDINAGLNNIFEDLHTGMTAVLGHELTHWMQENAPTEYLAYKKAVLQAIMSTKNGELRLERMIDAQINQNKREGKEITRSEAEDEIVADASMKRMGDTEFWDAVADNLGEKKADVAARIRDYISKFFQRVRELLRKASHTSEAARIVDRAEAEVQATLRRLYAEGIGAAIRNSVQTGVETKNAATEGGEVQYSSRSKYEDQVDAVLANTHDPNNHVNMGGTPVKLSNILGLPKLPMLATTNHIYTITVSAAQAQQDGRFNRKSHYHNLGRDTTVALPSLLNDPLLILKSNQDNTNAEFVVVTNQLDQNKDPIIAAIKPGGKGNYWNFEFLDNAFLSGYGKENFRDYIARAKTENRILYANKNSQRGKNTTGHLLSNTILLADYTNNLGQRRTEKW